MKRLIIIAALSAGSAGHLMAQSANDTTAHSLSADSIFRSLPEVMVKGERPVVMLNNGVLTYDMRKLTLGKATDNVYEALRHIPGITETNDKLQLNGREVSVLIDGKNTTISNEQMMVLLRTIPAERLSKTEVLYEAPARYGVKGAALNIILSAENANEQEIVQGEAFGKYDQEHDATFEERISGIIMTRRLSADIMYSHNHGQTFSPEQDKSVHTLTNGEAMDINNHGRTSSDYHSHTMRLGIDYSFAEKHKLSVVYNGSRSERDNKSAMAGTINSSAQRNHETWMHNAHIDYSLPFGLNASADYTYYESPSDQTIRSVMNGNRMDYNIKDQQRINVWRFILRQEHKLTDKLGLNYGADYKTSRDRSYMRYDIPPAGSENNEGTTLREHTTNVYAGMNGALTQKLSFDVSVAGEYFKNSKWNEWAVFPVVTLTHMASPSNIFQYSFSSGRNYPGYWELQNTTGYYGGAYSEIQGNPNLKPSKNHMLQTNFIHRNKYVFSAWFRHVDDYFVQTLYQHPERFVEIYRTVNFDFQQYAGVQASVPIESVEWLKSRLTIMGVWMREKDSDFYDIAFDRNIMYGMALWNATFNLQQNNRLRLEVNSMIRSKAIQGLYDLPASGNLDLSLLYDFGKNRRHRLRVYCNDIFETQSISPRMDYGRLKAKNIYPSFRSAGVSLTLRLGDYKEKERKEADLSRVRK